MEAAVLVLVLTVAACAPGLPKLVTADAGPALAHDRIRIARTALGAPLVELTDALAALARDLDDVRHTVPRGAPMQQGVDLLSSRVEGARDAAAAVEAALAAFPSAKPVPTGSSATASASALAQVETRVGAARQTVEAALERSTAALRAVEDELAALARYADLDRRMDAVVRGWDAPGSFSQRIAELKELTDEADALRDEASELPVSPAGCPALRDHRVRWGALLVERGAALAALVTERSGTDYDGLRGRYRRAPFGQDRAAADAQDRGCWEDRSELPQAVAVALAAVDSVQADLAGP